MFERYSESAKRVIFFARFEAAQMGFEAIESEHLLSGLLREGRGPANGMLANYGVTRERVEQAILSRPRADHPVSTSVDIPLSAESKRILQSAASEADTHGHLGIDTEHILFGILREDGCPASVLLNRLGLRPDELSEQLAERFKDPAWRRRELVDQLGVERAYADPSIRDRLSDATRRDAEDLLARARAIGEAAAAASARGELNEFAVLYAEEMELRDRVHFLLVD